MMSSQITSQYPLLVNIWTSQSHQRHKVSSCIERAWSSQNYSDTTYTQLVAYIPNLPYQEGAHLSPIPEEKTRDTKPATEYSDESLLGILTTMNKSARYRCSLHP